MWSFTLVDEIGYLAYDAHAADLLFQIISRRYEQRSIVVTTNLVFKDWHTVFPNASCAVALVDRLTHHAEIIRVEGVELPTPRGRAGAEEAAPDTPGGLSPQILVDEELAAYR
jgi:DNA replication protein DnaC